MRKTVVGCTVVIGSPPKALLTRASWRWRTFIEAIKTIEPNLVSEVTAAMAMWKWLCPEGKKAKDCPFCLLASGNAEGRTPNILFQDEQIVVFVDRNPSAYRHYLVVPNSHIKTVKDLRPGEADHALVSHMLKLGRSTLQRDAPNAPNYRFGFHKPPFNSVDHLHLHCMALPYNSVWRRMKYVGLGWWGAYVSVDRVLQYLDPKKGMPLSDQPEAPV